MAPNPSQKARTPGAFGQDVDIADIQPVLEIGLEQRADDLVLPFLAGAPKDQPV